MSNTTVGTCGICGGAVCVPTIWMGVNPPKPQCVRCHTSPKEAHGPILDMEPKKNTRGRYYRFNCGTFIEAESFGEAKRLFIERLEQEEENPENWRRCTCVGLSHQDKCPEMDGIITF